MLVHRVAHDVSRMASADKLGNLVPKNLPEGVLRLHLPALDRREVFGRFFAYIGTVNLILTYKIDLENQISIS